MPCGSALAGGALGKPSLRSCSSGLVPSEGQDLLWRLRAELPSLPGWPLPSVQDEIAPPVLASRLRNLSCWFLECPGGLTNTYPLPLLDTGPEQAGELLLLGFVFVFVFLRMVHQ